jgi:hypothetical protein
MTYVKNFIQVAESTTKKTSRYEQYFQLMPVRAIIDVSA